MLQKPFLTTPTQSVDQSVKILSGDSNIQAAYSHDQTSDSNIEGANIPQTLVSPGRIRDSVATGNPTNINDGVLTDTGLELPVEEQVEPCQVIGSKTISSGRDPSSTQHQTQAAFEA